MAYGCGVFELLNSASRFSVVGESNGQKAADSRLQGRIGQFKHIRVEPARKLATLGQDVTTGLLSKPRALSPKYFYDERGSKLFDRICNTVEYYVTRTESGLLHENAEEIIKLFAPRHIIEFGSGVSRKIRALLDACERLDVHCTYWAMDICAEIMEEGAHDLQKDYPWLQIRLLQGDYIAGLANLDLPEDRCLGVFLGSTIGNLPHEAASGLLRDIGRTLGTDNTLLLGIDRVKDKRVLEAAYNDRQGETASFNLNLLNVLNRELDADFSPENFSHHAFFNEKKKQVETYLVSKKQQKIWFGSLGLPLLLEEGEPIQTEVSRKFTRECIDELMTSCRYTPLRHFVADNEYFSLLLSRVSEV